MMKSLMFYQQQQQILQEENMSNLTSASGDQASVSSGNRNETGTNYGVQQYFAPPAQTQPPVKKKRNLPGNPDPDAEVIALSPKTLMATNRFLCEICNKGFQRDQNLQLHRRGHNLPWKLKQRTSKEVRKKVYVCPEPNCVHHDPSRALGDLTGIKKHFCRKHGEKKWKCVKCSKRYAVQSDWKAHAKTCGTREYRCDCGTLFSRRDSFITHRAFCEALAEESARAITGAPSQFLSTQPGSSTPRINLQVPQFSGQDLHAFSLKKEQQSSFRSRPDFPPWLACPPGLGGPGPPHQQTPIDLLSSSSSPSILSTRLGQEFTPTHQDMSPNPNPSLGPTLPQYPSGPSPHMSATALLQKAAQMGATVSRKTTGLMRPHHHQQQQEQAHVSANADNISNTNTAVFGLNLSSREELASGGLFFSGLAPFGNKAGPTAPSGASSTGALPSGALIEDMMSSLSSASGFEGTSLEDALVSGVLNSKKDVNFSYSLSKTTRNDNGGGSSGGNEGMTRDFLGLRPLSHSDILSMAGLSNCVNTSHEQQIHKPWKG
ncbi:protein indeterminate-domain 7 [Populus alba x Populus x berolinensis]|nr:protein indeterminate-domain 7 [Populus alba x Populus x berolinensis]